MQTVRYEIEIHPSRTSSHFSKEKTGLILDQQSKSSTPGEAILDFSDIHKAKTDGWRSTPVVTTYRKSISIGPNEIVEGGKRVSTPIDGLFLRADAQTRLDTIEFSRMFGPDPVLGVPLPASNADVQAFIFHRENSSIYIDRVFKFKNQSFINTLSDDEFTVHNTGGQAYALFPLSDPIPVTSLNGSGIEIDQKDYVKISYELESFLSDKEMSEANFLESLDYVSIKDLGIQSWLAKKIPVSLKTKYFPIFNQVTVFAKFKNRISRLGRSFLNGMDPNKGIVTLGLEFFQDLEEASEIDDLLGFYLFYGVVPGVFLGSKDASVREVDLISDDSPLTYTGIRNEDPASMVGVSEPTIIVGTSDDMKFSTTTVFVPKEVDKIFFQPEFPISLNNRRLQGGERMVVDNDGANRLTIGVPDSFMDLLRPVSIVNNTINIPSEMAIDSASIYGLFKYDGVNRFALMSTVGDLIRKNESESIASKALGFGEGAYGLGGYSEGSYKTVASNIILGVSNEVEIPVSTNGSINILPERDGYEFILPAWTNKDSVRVVEIGQEVSGPFTHWTFVDPDVLILDKSKAHSSRTYNISIDIVASPLIKTLDLNNNSVSVIINNDLAITYPGFSGSFILSNSSFKLRMGYVTETKEFIYFPQELDIHYVLDGSFIDSVVTGYKAILF